MVKLTDDSVKRLALGARPERIVRDGQDTGFAVRLRRVRDGAVAKTFFVTFEAAGADGKRKRRKVFIGEFPTFDVAAARAEARRMLQAAKRGDDPAGERRAKKDAPTFAAFADGFLKSEEFLLLKPSTRRDYANRIGRALKPAFGDRKVKDIDRASVIGWHRRGAAKHFDANRSLAVLSRMMATAIRDGLREDNPCINVKKYHEAPRDRWLDEHELPPFLEAMKDRTGAYADAIRFMTVSGWRISEARGLTWDMVDLRRLTANLPDTKTGAQVRALSTDAGTIIDSQAHRVGHVFSTRGGKSAIGEKQLRAELRAVCEAAGIAPVAPHALRHSAATWAAMDGAQASELREAFGWKTITMAARYVGRAESLGRKGVDRAAAAINIFGRPAATVEKVRP